MSTLTIDFFYFFAIINYGDDMRVNKNFSIAVNSILMMAYSKDERITSALVSISTGTNAVIVRNIFLDLKKNGLIDTSTGKYGGVHLLKDPSEITLLDIYNSVENEDERDIFKFYDLGYYSDKNPVAVNIYSLMNPHMDDAINAMKNEFAKVTIASLLNELEDLINNTTEPKHIYDFQRFKL